MDQRTKNVCGVVALLAGGCDKLALFSDAAANPDAAVAGHSWDGWSMGAGNWSSVEALADCSQILEAEGVLRGNQSVASGTCVVVMDDLSVAGTLQLEEGVQVAVAGGAAVEVLEGGYVVAHGVDDSPVVIAGMGSDGPSWAGVRVREGGSLKLLDTEIRDAGVQPHCCDVSDAAAVYVDAGGWAEFDGVVIEGSGGWAVAVEPDGALEEVDATYVRNRDGGVLEVREDRFNGSVEDGGAEGGVEGGVEGGGECDDGLTMCQGTSIASCQAGKWRVVSDCAMNVDSRRTVCGTYDGRARCDRPPPEVCRQWMSAHVEGLDDRSWSEEGGCTPPLACEEAALGGCLRTNVPDAPLVFEGTGHRRSRFELYDDYRDGYVNVVSGLRLRLLEGAGEYEASLSSSRIAQRVASTPETLGEPLCAQRHARVSADHPSDTTIWRTPAEWETSVGVPNYAVLEVRPVGDSCEAPWKVSVEPNPCPAVELPGGDKCDEP